MKKLLICIIIIALCLPYLGAAESTHIFEQSVGIVDQTANFNSIAALTGKIYAYDYINFDIYIYDANSGENRRVSAMIDMQGENGMNRCRLPIFITAAGGSLYALEAQLIYDDNGQQIEGFLWAHISVDEGVSEISATEVKLPDELADLGLGDIIYSVTSCAPLGGQLYLSYELGEGNYRAAKIDLQSGDFAETELTDVREFTVMDESHLLAVCRPHDSATASLYILGADGGSEYATDIPSERGVFGFAYLEKALYYVNGLSLMRLDSFDAEEATLISNMSAYIDRGAITPEGLYAASNRFDVFVRDVHAQHENVVLGVGGTEFPSGQAEGYFDLNPHVSIERLNQKLNEEIIDALLVGSDEVDIYFFNTVSTNGFELLRDRSYALPIDSEIVSAQLDKMYPNVRAYVSRDGNVYGVPVNCVPQMRIGVNMEIWRALGLADEELPATWKDFLLFIRDRWPDLYRQGGQYALCSDADNGREMIFTWIMNDYNVLIHNSSETTAYDTPEFRETLEAFESIDFAALPNDSEADSNDCLFRMNCQLTPENQRSAFEFLPLGFNDESVGAAPMCMTIAVINPFSSQPEQALSFLEYLITHMTPLTLRALCPGENEPALWDDVPAETRAELEAGLAAADDAEAYINENGDYYQFTPHSIAVYRANVRDLLIVTDYSINPEDYAALFDLQYRYFDGGISLSGFISELDRMLTMNAMEDM